MSYFLNPTIPDDYDDVWLIGFRIDPDRESADFYTIIFNGDRDVPLNEDNYLVLFSNLDVLYLAIKKLIPNIYSQLKQTKLFTVDLARILYLIQIEDFDDRCIIVNGLNIMLDLLSCTTGYFPQGYKTKLFKCADHFTFSKSISDFFSSNEFNRQEILNIIHWSTGAIISKSKFYTTKDLLEC